MTKPMEESRQSELPTDKATGNGESKSDQANPSDKSGSDAASESPDQARPPSERPKHIAYLNQDVETRARRPPMRRLTESDLRSRPAKRRRLAVPIVLFVVTCISTFWVGLTHWQPMYYDLFDAMVVRRVIVSNWQQGLNYMGCVLLILFMHEMGHFVATLLYRVPASLPFFIPIPFTPIGTMGAVIGMEAYRADRKQIFDIGLAGPIAGLVAAVPILWIGIRQLDINGAGYGSELYDLPLLVKWMLPILRPELSHLQQIHSSQLNSYFMAGWVGFLITGLNMLPVSQLDGGHVVYGLFGRGAHWIARGFIFLAIAYVVFGEAYIWGPMTILVILMGTDHPPTFNDEVPLGGLRRFIGYASLLIPILCFPPRGLVPTSF